MFNRLKSLAVKSLLSDFYVLSLLPGTNDRTNIFSVSKITITLFSLCERGVATISIHIQELQCTIFNETDLSCFRHAFVDVGGKAFQCRWYICLLYTSRCV